MKGHVLVVDDEQETCDLLEMSLGRHGFKVTASTNAQRALDLVVEQDFDVVLTDLQMPEMSGRSGRRSSSGWSSSTHSR